jgi:hypothetical protein
MSRGVTEPMFNLPEFPESSTCKQSLQVAPNVGDMAAGQVVEGEYGPAEILHIEVSKWRFSEKPKHRLTFRDSDSGEEYTRGYFPWSPIRYNHAYEARFTAPYELVLP